MVYLENHFRVQEPGDTSPGHGSDRLSVAVIGAQSRPGVSLCVEFNDLSLVCPGRTYSTFCGAVDVLGVT